MRLAFEDVSYSYEGGEAKKKRGRRKKDAGRQADWGNAPDAVWALRDVTFTVEPGEFFGVAGHTGSGKSTLIQHMNGLVHPTCGRVLADGRDLAEKGVATEVRRQVGLVFQYPENQLFANTVYDDVAFGPRNMGLGAEEVDRRVREGLALVGLSFDELSERSPFDLSGGQQRRVAFAGVLAMEPEVLVLDEPVAGLDPLSREEFLGLIRELHAGGRTIVMVSHSMEDLAALSDRILVLSEGRLFRLGTPAEVFADAAALKAVGLGAPAPEAFAASLREAGFTLGTSHERTLAADIAAQLRGGDAMPDAPSSVSRDSLVHAMDPRVKFILSFVLMAAVFCAATPLSLAVAALFIVGFYAASRIPLLQAIRAIGPLLVLVVLTALLNVLFVQGGHVYFEFGIICISEKGLQSAVFIGCRLLLLLMGMSLLTLTTTTLDITAAFERLMAPLSRIGVPAHELGMILGIALRFLPQFMTELGIIYRAQKSRGAHFNANPFRGGIQSLTALLIPLFTSAFRHAETLSAAMEARCYHGGVGTTRLEPLRLTWRDAVGTAALLLMIAAVIATNYIPLSF
ncbi:MAG: CbiQ family ECF transporter T component [Adlercreutzia equolifaciens]